MSNKRRKARWNRECITQIKKRKEAEDKNKRKEETRN